ncbi:DUF441 domain-containing protein [Corticibacter populi]|uniref:UPF0756 membrane protein D8I35_12180 n=1 Tax=Corticibacter populi TaxID=1550736 RepID=A0A3M6QSE0_9BURK|nr:DUF441 domain-containing protein [Corticibacter populi]RMX05903.1 DUF441 domain-containing protein [Corticibacter populi]RZS30777.1 uncharacterized membrane protein (DUF441 family) [Corticibacter populi]
MSLFDSTSLILLAIAGLGIVSHNTSVAVAMLCLLLIRLTPLHVYFPLVQKHGLTVGIIILLVAVMTPIASGKIGPAELLRSFMHWKPLLAVIVGVVVAWLGGRGVTLMGSNPAIVPGLMVGTVLGVAFFKGVPVGPLIAAGLLSLLLGKS